ncbi:MAG: aldehyde dehydrogenase family protein [Planctomycetota bacterium]
MSREAIDKTLKMFVGGAFVRSESGRTLLASGRSRVPAASRKDLRAAVEAAEHAGPKWACATGYLRGQIVYRLAEMLEDRRASLEALTSLAEVDAAIDLVVSLAGWSDKASQVFGGANPVAGPYHNFTIPGPSGVHAVVCPDHPALLGALGLIVPPLVTGSTVIALLSRASPEIVALGEVFATSDVPAGAVNLLTGDLEELASHIASHRSIRSVVAVGVDQAMRTKLERGAAENLKRVVVFETPQPESWPAADLIERALEFKTIWHPSSV